MVRSMRGYHHSPVSAERARRSSGRGYVQGGAVAALAGGRCGGGGGGCGRHRRRARGLRWPGRRAATRRRRRRRRRCRMSAARRRIDRGDGGGAEASGKPDLSALRGRVQQVPTMSYMCDDTSWGTPEPLRRSTSLDDVESRRGRYQSSIIPTSSSVQSGRNRIRRPSPRLQEC